MNVELALEVKEHILKHPEQARIESWAEETECGTVACIAGWTCLLGGDRVQEYEQQYETDFDNYAGYACELLDIDLETGESVFFPDHWTFEEHSCLIENSTPDNPYPQAAAMAMRIDRLIREQSA